MIRVLVAGLTPAAALAEEAAPTIRGEAHARTGAAMGALAPAPRAEAG
ncbi:hypothetical protein DFR50_109165 [Roseiarcus fermentans]|uniref:Uncharacterized protein n=1 Tax=Roseiarcus fermentans TaxID=1473586 RepID=A0A366FIJ6_9HYPH|nr:hypothetical protein [Roseiarcus fermentans]RBP14411.1 hypothetical protein DFR50_109165 [Roseiarcus fermentans]